MTAAWTPDAPDGALADSPSALIAAGQPPFDPESLDHFDGVPVCGAQLVAVIPPSETHSNVWQRIIITCTDDAGHDAEGGPHSGTYEWGNSNTLPADPLCKVCADVGVTPQGEPCVCPAGDKFLEAVKVARDAEVAPDGD